MMEDDVFMKSQREKMVNKYHQRYLEDKFKDIEVGRAEAPYILMINQDSPIKMNVLISRVVFHKSHATRAINQMVKDGLVIKQTDPEDKRGYILTITQKGSAIANKVDNIVNEWEELVNKALSDEELKQLEVMRQKVYLHLKTFFEEENDYETDV